MASKTGQEGEYSRKDVVSAGRFAYDVMVYTLKKCGLPETSLPTTDYRENLDLDDRFVKIAGVSALRVALVMRDEWKKMFVSRRNSYGFGNEDVPAFLENLLLCCPPSRTTITKSVIELLLASCNEIIMYFHLESIDIDFSNLIKSVSVYIVGTVGMFGNETDEIFDRFEDLSGYTEWITEFITKFAIPYGSRDDVSDLFLGQVRKQYRNEVERLKDRFRFLPHDHFLAVTVEGSENLGKSIPSDDKQLESPKLPKSSVKGAMGGKKLRGSISKNVSEHSAQSKQSTKTSSDLEIEHGLGKMCLDAEEDCQESHATMPKHKTAENEDDTKEQQS